MSAGGDQNRRVGVSEVDVEIRKLKRKIKSSSGVAQGTRVAVDLGWSSKKDVSRSQYVFYKTLLMVLYIIYGIFRYAQYQYHRMKLRMLNIIYNPSRTPQLIRQDVVKLEKIPRRIAAILEMKPIGDVGGGVKGLLNDGAELACWTVAAGVKHLMLYDYNGVLKANVNEFRREVVDKLGQYFGPENVPKFAVKVPHLNKVYFSTDDSSPGDKKVAIEISLISNRDGRETIVDLAKTMSELCSSNELKVSDITMKLVDDELVQLVGAEPDLLLYFGPSLNLQGFPPWHIRLTELYWEEDNNQVTYLVFIRGLQKYSTCKINVGK